MVDKYTRDCLEEAKRIDDFMYKLEKRRDEVIKRKAEAVNQLIDEDWDELDEEDVIDAFIRGYIRGQEDATTYTIELLQSLDTHNCIEKEED